MERSIATETSEEPARARHPDAGVQRVCIQWPRFGPYHRARLDAAHAHFAQHGAEVVGLETASRDATYAWRTDEAPARFRRIQVFPGRTLEELTPAAIYAGVTATLDRLGPDAVAINSYSFPDALACLAWCRRHRRIAVVMSDSKQNDAPRAAWRERIKAFLLSHFDAALLAGTPQRAYFEQLGFPPEAITLGYDVIDNAFFAERAREVRQHPEAHRHLPGLASDTPFFLAVSRFVPRKNLDGLLHAYTRYRRRAQTPWNLVLVGDGPDRAVLERLIETEPIGGVTLAGFQQIEAMPAYYGRAGAFVHPAWADQWGLVVNEAMASSLPVLVSTGAGCVYDLLRDGENGFTFDPDDTMHLAHLLGEIAAPGRDRAALGRRSQEIIARWSLDRFAEALWWAVEAGRPRARRPFSPTLRAFLWLLRKTARHVRSFHVIRE